MRNYKIDNLKAILIFLVVLAHFFELFVGSVKYKLYIIIYMFHMPAFVFTTGYFAKPSIKNIVFRQLIPYIIFQILYCKFLGWKIGFARPYWIMWYLLACTGWTLSLYVVKSKYPIWIILSVITAILAGFVEKIGYNFSLSRMICFYPFFLLGVWLKNLNINTEKFKITAIISLITAFVVSYMIVPHISTSWVYHATSYEVSGCMPQIRFLLILLGFVFTISLFFIIPNKDIKGITYLGKYTISIYLIHGFIVKSYLVYYKPFLFPEWANILFSLVFSIAIVYTFGNRYVSGVIRTLTDFGFVYDKCRKIFTK